MAAVRKLAPADSDPCDSDSDAASDYTVDRGSGSDESVSYRFDECESRRRSLSFCCFASRFVAC
jgi:hypothetical protein